MTVINSTTLNATNLLAVLASLSGAQVTAAQLDLKAAAIVAKTPATGFALTAGTPTIFTYTTPNDGNEHAYILFNTVVGTGTLSTGQSQLQWTSGGQTNTLIISNASNGDGTFNNTYAFAADPNTAINYTQNVALSGGGSMIEYASLLGA